MIHTTSSLDGRIAFVKANVSDYDTFWGTAHAGCEKNHEHVTRLTERDWDTYWYGFTKADTRKHVAQGWVEGAERLRSLANELMADLPPATSIRRKHKWGEEGDEIDMQRVYAGQLDRAWRGPQRVSRKAPRVVTISGMVGATAGYSTDALFWIGATAVAIAEKLEEAGYQVELIGQNVSVHHDAGGKQTCTMVTVKSSHEPLNIEAAAVAFCHSAVFRRLGLSAKACAPWDIGVGFGSTSHNVDEHRRVLAEAAKASVIEQVPDLIVNAAYSKESAIQIAKQLIERLNALAEEQ